MGVPLLACSFCTAHMHCPRGPAAQRHRRVCQRLGEMSGRHRRVCQPLGETRSGPGCVRIEALNLVA